ncbi:MAG TPA: hypothetical protein VLC73_08085 [Burkholderiales bacterium]|nr:hypothetical protein [Burkholderiales bacterium]
MRVALPLRWFFALLACPVFAAAADLPATLTLLEGPAGLVRGVTRYALAEGVRMQAGDIIEVGDKGLAELEFPDGAAIAMGPGTRMLAISMPRGKSAAGDFHVMAGALKISGASKDARLRISTPVFTLWPAEGASVMVVRGGDGSVFIESGAARLAAAPATHNLRSGEFFSRKDGQKGAVSQRPSKPFMDAMPKAFFDPLPSRMARYKDREAQPRRIEEVSYADVEVWLKAPAGIRRPLVARFESRAEDPKFRSALEANLRFHPEWDPILYPEKYLPPEPAAESAAAPSAAQK